MPVEISRIKSPDVVISIVAPIGSDTPQVLECLKRQFIQFGYDPVPIKVTDIFKTLNLPEVSLVEHPIEKRYKSYIKFGNQLRLKTGDNSVLAALTIQKIKEHRDSKEEGNKPTAYIVHQFKRAEEIELLKQIYGRLFFQISIFSSKIRRKELLSHKIAEDHNSVHTESYTQTADELVNTDENEGEEKHGQRVSKVFHLADFIINSDISTTIENQVQRFLNLLFGDNSISPSQIEYGMYMAKAASLRSLDLSRQVGAAIFTESHEIISMGCNEVPKGGGGTYWENEQAVDARDYTKNGDTNEKKKKFNIIDFLSRLQSLNYLDSNITEFDEIIEDPQISDADIMGALEFGRIVHAEMSAISDAARVGHSTKESILYCTTFPCHMCAKHIVASGIKKVIYLEPYPKSVAFELHNDSLNIDGRESQQFRENKKCGFEHFYGVSPKRYRDFFEKGKRKENGSFKRWKHGTPSPIYDIIVEIYEALEDIVVKEYISELEGKYPEIFQKIDT